MTCMKQEFCIHEKYCQRHIGQNFDSCILFSRNSKPMTNEEWLRQCTTEQLVIFLAKQKCDGCNDEPYDDKHGTCKYCMMKKTEQVREWLKQPHQMTTK